MQFPSKVLLTNAVRFSDCTFLILAVDQQPSPLSAILFSDTLSSFCSYNLPSKSLLCFTLLLALSGIIHVCVGRKKEGGEGREKKTRE